MIVRGPRIEVRAPLSDGVWLVQDGQDVQRLVNFLEQTKECVTVDTETIGCNPREEHPRYKARATSVQFSTEEIPRIYLDNYGKYDGNIQHIRKWVESEDRKKDGHNLKYEGHVFKNHGMRMRGVEADTIVLDYLLDTSREGGHKLEDACMYWGIAKTPLADYTETFRHYPLKKNGEPKKKSETRPHWEWWDMGDHKRVIDYAVKDSFYTRLMRKHHERKMRDLPWGGSKSYWDYYRMIDLPMLDVLLEIEWEGSAVDVPLLDSLAVEFQAEIERYQREFLFNLSEAGVPQALLENFNMGSSQQLGHVLYDVLDYKCVRWTGARPGEGSRSVDEVALTQIKDEQGGLFLEPLFKAREYGKLNQTYAVGLSEWAAQYKGRVHTSFNQIGTATMRLSSSKPNLQNIPARSELGKSIRRAFIAPEGSKLIVADYSQIELRVAAHKSNDPTLVRYFDEGKDPHALTAYNLFPEIRRDIDSRNWDVDTKEVQKYIKTTYKRLRDQGKTWNFMVIYGGGEQRAMDIFKVGKHEARSKIDSFFSTYPELRGMLTAAQRRAYNKGFIETIIGRRCHLPLARHGSFSERKRAERQAPNYEIQGSAQDIIKMGMISLHRSDKLRKLGYRQTMQIHDEVVGHSPYAEECKPEVERLMANSYVEFGFRPMRVETPVEAGVGDNWAEAKV